MNRFTLFRLFFTALISTVLLHSTLIAADAKEEKWVSLFNGKDLTGWKTHPDDKAKWEVVDGMIVGTGPVGHLYSEKGDYKNFKYKLEVSIGDKGNSGQSIVQVAIRCALEVFTMLKIALFMSNL